MTGVTRGHAGSAVLSQRRRVGAQVGAAVPAAVAAREQAGARTVAEAASGAWCGDTMTQNGTSRSVSTVSAAPLVSIIVITLNEAAIVGRCLERVVGLARHCPPVEVIIADGGSTDGTLDIARHYGRVVSAGRRGRAAGLNAGAAVARGDILLFLHADTLLPPDALTLARRTLTTPGMVGGRFRVALDNPQWRFRLVAASINLRDRLLGGFTGDQAVFVRADTFRRMGGYAGLPLMEDLDFARRLERQGGVARLDRAITTAARRWERHGLVRTILLMWTLRLLYRAGVPPRYLASFYRDAR
jgi:rSAM/selenodomain-associated transferase 2